MIVSFIPWADLGVTIFDAGATTQEVTTTVTGEELVSAYDEANGTTTALAAPVEATSVAEEEVTPAWSSFLTGVPLGSWYFDEASCSSSRSPAPSPCSWPRRALTCGS